MLKFKFQDLTPLLESAGLLSPLVIKGLLMGGGTALDLFIQKSTETIYAANLSASLVEREMIDNSGMLRLIDRLMEINGVGF